MEYMMSDHLNNYGYANSKYYKKKVDYFWKSEKQCMKQNEIIVNSLAL